MCMYIPQPFRGFAFITFLTGEEAEMVIREQHVIKGGRVNVGVGGGGLCMGMYVGGWGWSVYGHVCGWVVRSVCLSVCTHNPS